uniref:Protein phosphatase 1 regulatory subunit 26 N-terminal domain-containing protein n=1 Tax=Scleropages formosus TaxID=113540 RepID=A0A8C9T2M1_SCLFO
MFLKNVPPVAAMHTEWRPYGPARTFSLPLCFGDASSSSISATDKPLPDEVQMIIDSLRSTQSTLNMNDENNGTLQVGEAQGPGYNGKANYAVHKATQTGAPGGVRQQKQKIEAIKVEPQSQDSDSDDSVDRGIEEAIQEYLKEKGDHKQNMKLNSSPLQVSKQLRRNLTSSETPKYSNSNKILTASNLVPKSLKANHSIISEKKPVQKEKNEGSGLSCKDTDARMVKSPIDLNFHSDRVEHPVIVKEEEVLPESSSDDGIEEAIWHFQLEKIKKHRDSRNPSKVFQTKEESESSSDDGIEEAIRHYQLEKQKEKCENTTKSFKASLSKPTKGAKAAMQGSGQSSSQAIKKQKVSIKKKKTEKFSKSALPSPVTVRHSFSPPLDNHDTIGIEVSSNNTGLLQPQTPAPLKANTTAELMCAEAILDISKAVMPEAFHNTTFLTTFAQPPSVPAEDCFNLSGKKSDESSVDSDDGIEQEIRKFLESKAQMHKQYPDTKYNNKEVDEILQNKLELSQNKKVKSSLSRKRKRKEDSLKAKIEQNIHQKSTHDNYNDLKVPGTNEGALNLSRSKNEIAECLSWTERQSGEKSSSLDSDEDLDQAIKDLLKTKRKVKKKSREKKLKPRKRANLWASESSHEAESERKKIVIDNSSTNPKTFISRNLKNCKELPKHTVTDKCKVGKNNPKQQNTDKTAKLFGHVEPTFEADDHIGGITQAEEDSSSVDSDDSIEQEIRKFLAEKAKESTVRTSTPEIRDNSLNSTDFAVTRTGVVEAQQAEVSPNTPALYSCLPQSDGSLQPGYHRGDSLPSSPSNFCTTKSNKDYQTGGPREADKTLMNSDVNSVEINIQNVGPDGEKCKSIENSCISPSSNTDSKHVNQIISPRETEVFQSQCENPFHSSPLCPEKELEVSVTDKSDLHRVVNRHQAKSVLSTEAVSPTMVDSIVSRQKLGNPCAQSPEMALTIFPPNPELISAQLQVKHYKHQPAKDSCREQPAASTTSENAVHTKKDCMSFIEPAAHRAGHIQVKNLGRGEDGTCPMGEMVGRKTEKRAQVREGREEKVDERDFESEGRTSGNQWSEQTSQHHRL